LRNGFKVKVMEKSPARVKEQYQAEWGKKAQYEGGGNTATAKEGNLGS